VRSLWIVGIVLGALWLHGRKGRPGRSPLERELQEAASAGGAAFGDFMTDAVAGAGRIWDEATTITGAPASQGSKNAAVAPYTQGSLLGLPERELRSIEPMFLN
jgi:hypothetical protein